MYKPSAIVATIGTLSTLLVVSTTTQAQQQKATPKPSPITIPLELSPKALNMDALRKNQMGYMPNGLELIAEKPAPITKEPAYKGIPKYGAFRLGNGPKSNTYFAVDEIKGEPGRIFVDKNQNGDLSDDGEGKWDEAKESDGVMWYQSTLELHASWGSPVKETESGSYAMFFYRRHGDARVNWTKFSARTGKFDYAGKTYPIMLAENDSDALFTVTKRGDRTRRPVQVMIDIDGDGTFKGVQTTLAGKKVSMSEVYYIDQPFQFNGAWWDAFPTLSGAELTLVPTSAPGEKASQAGVPVEEKTLLANGTLAPNFTVLDPKGKTISLSSFKGQVVLLDFWATWCGPCKAAMPGLEKIYKQIKKNGVVVFSVNVWDTKDAFDAWVAKYSGETYSFTFAYDLAGNDMKKSIAAAKYQVSGIPTMYVIGRDGKIKSSIVGSGNEKTLVAELGKLGIKASAE